MTRQRTIAACDKSAAEQFAPWVNNGRNATMENCNTMPLHRAVEAELIHLSGGHGKVERHTATGWASITFVGTRHEVTIVFNGDEAVNGGEAMIEKLPDYGFCISGQLVADASIKSIDHKFGEQERLEVTVALLLLEDDPPATGKPEQVTGEA